MKGKIKVYSEAVNAGIIKGSDGKEYPFSLKEWIGKLLPAYNQDVHFDQQQDRAKDIKDIQNG